MLKPRIFISHCEKNMEATDYAIRIIHALGCTPVIAERVPKKSRSIHLVVRDSMNSCEAVVVIATPDLQNGKKFSPSNGVSGELAILRNGKKWKNRYFVVKEENVVLSAMSDEARYTFIKGNYSEIAFAIITELDAMNLFKNYYELKGSELKIHDLLDTFHHLKELFSKGHMKKNEVAKHVKDCSAQIINSIISKGNGRKN